MLAHSILKLRLQKPNAYLDRNSQFDNLFKKKLLLKFLLEIQKFSNICTDKSLHFANIALIKVKLKLQKPNVYLKRNSQFNNLFKRKLSDSQISFRSSENFKHFN